MVPIKNRIVEHAAELFAKKGCKALTMDDIATSLGMSKRTIYENFAAKNDLLQACVELFFEQGNLLIQQILASSNNILEAMFEQMQTNSKMMGHIKFNFFEEIRKYYPEVYNNTIKRHKEKHLQDNLSMLQKGQKDGVVRKDVNVKIMAVLIHETTTMIFTSDTFNAYDLDRKKLISALMYSLTRGICSEKGLKILDNYVEKHEKYNV